jgi:hypothetical protein
MPSQSPGGKWLVKPERGPSPYSLILLGDDMYLFERKEYDPQQGTWRTLAPGDPGRPHR